MFEKVKISIVGATGYIGLELIRMLAAHPNVEIVHLLSKSYAGKKVSEIYPHLQDLLDLELEDAEMAQVAEDSDCVFLALPHGVSQGLVPELLGKVKIIDLSSDYRLQDKNMFEKYHFVYGFSELYKEQIRVADNLANPGCFAYASQLALLPLKEEISKVEILAITGSSGSGKELKEATHHPIRAHNVKSYQMVTHRHIPEILQSIGIQRQNLTFVPTSGPFVRGIHLTAFVSGESLAEMSGDEADNLFKQFYEKEPFVRVKSDVQLVDVIGSNFCDLCVKKINDKIVVQAVLDNLVKGAAGSAIQNFNLMFGFDETCGLKNIYPLYP